MTAISRMVLSGSVQRTRPSLKHASFSLHEAKFKPLCLNISRCVLAEAHTGVSPLKRVIDVMAPPVSVVIL